jgi:hypothetical protein
MDSTLNPYIHNTNKAEKLKALPTVASGAVQVQSGLLPILVILKISL